MRIEEIEIHTGATDFGFRPVRRLEARCEAPTFLSKAPTIEDVNKKLREMAASVGANAVVNVRYETGPTLTSWRSTRGYGLAIMKRPDEIACPVCAEKIKRAARKCRFCGAEVTPKAVEPEEVMANTVAGPGEPAATSFASPETESKDWLANTLQTVMGQPAPPRPSITPTFDAWSKGFDKGVQAFEKRVHEDLPMFFATGVKKSTSAEGPTDEPLRSTDNPQHWMVFLLVVAVVLAALAFLSSASQ